MKVELEKVDWVNTLGTAKNIHREAQMQMRTSELIIDMAEEALKEFPDEEDK
tara:strand:- start:9126 stop:9281 length:156 start_codon:yes stop_codon:yes gene_type:complete